MTHSETLLFLIKKLLGERNDLGEVKIPDDEGDRFRLYRSLVNIRPAMAADEDYLEAEDRFLREEISHRGITDISDMPPCGDGIFLWQGDITSLRCGAVVNAANSGLTGCWRPCHGCIDNAIHTFAGVRLRYECSKIIEEQGHEEMTGGAKVTKAYALPCEYVIHTVGPIVSGRLTPRHCEELRSCYISCLEAAVKNHIDSIAFCCISTGVFGFPQKKAAEIAVQTVREFRENNDIRVIFNVFKDEDAEIYRKLLG